MIRKFMAAIFLAVLLVQSCMVDSMAASAGVIDSEVNKTMAVFGSVAGADYVIKHAKGILVFPNVIKAGFGLGGEYGEGALRIKGKTVGYYNTAAASIGFQLGVQKKSIIIAFMDQQALNKFRNSSGWKIGADASVAVLVVGVGGAIDTARLNEPIVGFVFDQKGLMYNLTLEGAKITKIRK